MRIIVENSGYELWNLGDLAMLQIALSRFIELWPKAEIHVLTARPDLLVQNCPGAIPLPLQVRKVFFMRSSILGRLGARFPDWEDRIRQSPLVSQVLLQAKSRLRRTTSAKRFADIVYGADLVVATGGGYFTDAFTQHTLDRLRFLQFAIQIGKPVAMVGQGIGPLSKPEFCQVASEVFPQIRVIGLREELSSKPLLRSFGVPEDRIIVTGDDAVEMAFKERRPEIGEYIGINLRVASYSGVGNDSRAKLGVVLRKVVEELATHLVPIPISVADNDSDVRTIEQLLTDINQKPFGSTRLTTPIEVIRQAGKCRVVVTGSYHAGVFALSQGIPVVGIAQSEYYKNKFQGLANQFGDGCRVISLDDTDSQEHLLEAIFDSWDSANQQRHLLLSAAERQIASSRAVYQQLRLIAQEKQ